MRLTPANFDESLHVFRSLKLQSMVNEAIQVFAKTPVYRLPLSNKFSGPGVYGLYYVGHYELYAPIANLNRDACVQPIYVGKAVPPGWRTARATKSDISDLWRRLREHARSIQQTKNLQIDHFLCRFMILRDAESNLISTVEAELIPILRTVFQK